MTTQRRPTQTLQSMLALEEKLGYEDRAVAGGLDKFLRNVLKDGDQAQFFKRDRRRPAPGRLRLAHAPANAEQAGPRDVRAALRPGAAPGQLQRRTRTSPEQARQDPGPLTVPNSE